MQFVNFYKQWCKFIKRDIVFNRFTTIYKNNKLITKKMQENAELISLDLNDHELGTNNVTLPRDKTQIK